MPTNRATKNKQLHAARLRAIRKYVDFDYDLRKSLTPAQKRKVKLYYDEVRALQNRPYQVYRPRRADHLHDAQEFAGHETRLKGLKVAFIPNDGGDRLKVRFTKKGVVAKGAHVEIQHIRLKRAELLRDPLTHVRDRIRPYAAKSYTIQAGRYEIPASFSKDRIAEGVAKFVSKYNIEDANNYFGNWLHGIFAYQFHDQDSLQDYLVHKQSVIKGKKRERRAAARKATRQRNLGRR